MAYSEKYKAKLRSKETYTAAAFTVLLAGMGVVDTTLGEGNTNSIKSYKLVLTSSPTTNFEVINYDVGYVPEILPELQKTVRIKAKVRRISKIVFPEEFFE